jgi:hypothetical protein
VRPALEPAAALADVELDRLGLRPVVVAHDIWLAGGLQRALPQTALACISGCDAIDVLRAQGTEVFCLSEHAGPPATTGMSSVDLLRHPATAAFFKALGPTAVLAFKPSERIAEIVEALGGRLLAAPSTSARAYENKLAFVTAAERAGVPRPRWDVLRLPLDYRALAADLGEPVVVQGARGNAGRRTWLVHSQAELDEIGDRALSGPVRIAEWIEGMPFTATGVAFSAAGGTLQPARLAAMVEPCRQVTGVDWLTPQELGSCGNAWGEPTLEPHLVEVQRCVRALGADLSANNYHGLFGVDFVLAADGPLVIEVNPRMVASLPMATELEVEAGRAPLLLLHLLEMLDVELDDIDDMEAAAPLGSASQVIVHHLPGDGDSRPRSGVYRQAEDGSMAFVRPGASVHDLRTRDELLLLTRRTGEPVTEGREFARIYTRSPEGDRVPGMRDLVDYLRAAAG